MLCVTRRNSMREAADRHALARPDPHAADRAGPRVRAPRASARPAPASAPCRRRALEVAAARAAPRRCDPRARASAPAPVIRYCCSWRRSGMIRSTPSSSGSGNMTPASTRMAVSPQATTIMFMPNSPSPPSGISSSGGDVASTTLSVRNVVRMRPQLRDLRRRRAGRAASGSRGRERPSAHRGGRRRSHAHRTRCWDSASGTVGNRLRL